MADNVTIPATGSGSATPVVATDDIGGVHHQLIKMEFGADGSVTSVSDTNPLPVKAKQALTASAPTFATVGVASAEAVPLNANRKGLILVNTSANRMSLGFSGNAAVLDSGVTLSANGGTYNMGEHDFTTGAIAAIAAGAGSNLGVQEFT